MGKILAVYRNSYYALIDLYYSIRIGSSFSEDDNIQKSALMAFFLYGLFGGTFTTSTYRLFLSQYKLKEEDAVFKILFVLPFIINYFLLYNRKQHNYYLTVKGSIPAYGYVLALFFVGGWFVYMSAAWYFDLPL